MPKTGGWSRDQLIVALKLYCEIPFGKIHYRNPKIIDYAKLIGRTPSALAMKLTNFASLDPEIRSTGRKGLSGASQTDRDIWAEMTSNWSRFASEIEPAESRFGRQNFAESSDSTQTDVPEDYRGETRTTTIEARIGQSLFRQSVLSAYDFKCCVTGINLPELLVASHIIPWRADTNNRLNPRNGLCLSSIHDRAFDAGLISISTDLCLLVSKRLRERESDPFVRNSFHAFAGNRINLPSKFAPDMSFLEYHRANFFDK
jgi:predicted restriction endonuclease